MNKQFTANDVRRLSNRIPRNNDEIADAQEALRAYADRLEADEKAEPIYQWQHRPMHHPEYWKDCRNKEEWDHKRNSLPEAVFRIVYTNPSSADAERLAEALRNGLIDALRHQRQIDECGEEVGVSRQAVDEAAELLSELAAHLAYPQPSRDAKAARSRE